MISPCWIASIAAGQTTGSSPPFTALRKCIRAMERATSTFTPAATRHVTACSRDDPQPQLLPATMMSPGFTLEANVGSRSSSACFAISATSVTVYVYLPGKITSVLTLSPYFQARPWYCIVDVPFKYRLLLNAVQNQSTAIYSAKVSDSGIGK